MEQNKNDDKKAKLVDWILHALKNRDAPEDFNKNIFSGLTAYYKPSSLGADPTVYEYHFIYRKNGIEIAHVAATYQTLIESFNYQHIPHDQDKRPIFNKIKLEKLCEEILRYLEKHGVYKLGLKEKAGYVVIAL